MKNNCIVDTMLFWRRTEKRGSCEAFPCCRWAVSLLSACWGCSARSGLIYRSQHPKSGRSIAKDLSENAGELREGRKRARKRDHLQMKEFQILTPIRRTAEALNSDFTNS